MSIKQYFNVLSSEECAYILEKRKEYSTIDGVLKDFIVFKKEADSTWETIIKNLQEKTKPFVNEYVDQFLGLFPKECLDISHVGFLNDNFGSFTEPHYDWELVILKEKVIVKPFVMLIYLTGDFTGGELVFPIQGFTSKPEKGSVVVFPCHFTYPHLSTPILEGSKHLCRLTFMLDSEIYKVNELEI